MILRYGMTNFANFKEGIVVPFELTTSCSEKYCNGKSYTPILCVKGANASGKTNLLKGLSFLSEFCCNSFSQKPEELIPFESHFFSKEPTNFFVDFMSMDIKYRYELSLTEKKVISEKIYRIKNRSVLIFKREKNRIIDPISEFKDLEDIKKIRSNASIISIANQHEINCMMPIYNFFFSILSNVNYYGLSDISHDLSAISKLYKEDEESFEFMKEIILKCDMGISDIKISTKKDTNNEKQYYPIFHHKCSNDKTNSLLYDHQSSGTRSLYTTLYKYWMSLEYGFVLIMDEFDIYLHPHILPVLLELFTNDEINKHDTQLIFTTHNTNVINSLGKYRTLLLNKDENESFGYRLDEIPGDLLRNDRNITPIYNSGKIGGIPKI